MKSIIVAAGQGTRLQPLTNDRPKCMVDFRGESLIDTIVKTMKSCNVNDITVIGGYKFDILKKHLSGQNIKFYENPKYDITNMVNTLFYAEDEMNDDIIISYSDIIYSNEVLESLISSKADFAVVVDKKWEQLWKVRMENPLDDAESMILNKQGNIVELGKKTSDYKNIQGQYIGLMKISSKALPRIKDFYNGLDKNALYDSKDFSNMYMTSFIQLVIDNLLPVSAVKIEGGWLEIDSTEDLNNYIKHNVSIN